MYNTCQQPPQLKYETIYVNDTTVKQDNKIQTLLLSLITKIPDFVRILGYMFSDVIINTFSEPSTANHGYLYFTTSGP